MDVWMMTMLMTTHPETEPHQIHGLIVRDSVGHWRSWAMLSVYMTAVRSHRGHFRSAQVTRGRDTRRVSCTLVR